MPKTRSTCVGRCTRLCSNNGRCNATRPPRQVREKVPVVSAPIPATPPAPITVGQILRECIPTSAWTGSRLATWTDFTKNHGIMDVPSAVYMDTPQWARHNVWFVFTLPQIFKHRDVIKDALHRNPESVAQCKKNLLREYVKVYVEHALLCMWTHPELLDLRERVDLMIGRIWIWASMDIPATITDLLDQWTKLLSTVTTYGGHRPVLSAVEIISRLNGLSVAELCKDPLAAQLRSTVSCGNYLPADCVTVVKSRPESLVERV